MIESIKDSLLHPEEENYLNMKNIPDSPELGNFLQLVLALRSFLNLEVADSSEAPIVRELLRVYKSNADSVEARKLKKTWPEALNAKFDAFLVDWSQKHGHRFRKLLNVLIKRDPHLFGNVGAIPDAMATEIERELYKGDVANGEMDIDEDDLKAA